MEEEIKIIRDKLKELLVENLSLEDVKPEDIADDAPIFGEGIGLDSLDAVEIVVILQRNFGVEIKDMNQGREILKTVDSVARYVYEQSKDKK